jgi:hypothetical protein
LFRNCVSGHIYDSGPLDVTSDFGFRFSLHPSIAKVPGPSKLASLVAKSVASGLDALYLTRFESQSAEHWQALYSSVVSIYFYHFECFMFLFCTLVN